VFSWKDGALWQKPMSSQSHRDILNEYRHRTGRPY
jgi:hypothetical protein